MTYAAFRKIVITLADAYCTNWSGTPVENNLQRNFTIITATEKATSSAPTVIAPIGHLTGSLELGQWVEDPNGAGAVHAQRGFGAHVHRIGHFVTGERVPAPEAVFYQAYPCEAAYVAADPIEEAVADA